MSEEGRRASTLIAGILTAHEPADACEAADRSRLVAHLATTVDPWARAGALHCTGSALVVHPPSRRVLLRWHVNLKRFLHVGGHGDPGEDDPFAVARREAEEETGLVDLRPYPGPSPELVQLAIVSVPARPAEPVPHEHADFRYLLATDTPDAAMPENPAAVLAWCTVSEALAEVGDDRLGVCIAHAKALFSASA